MALVSYLNPNKNIPPITYKDCVQQEGLNCGLHVLLNIKHFISKSDEFLEDLLLMLLDSVLINLVQLHSVDFHSVQLDSVHLTDQF